METDTSEVVDLSHQLVSSARVEGTPIYNPAGKKLGTVHSVMIHKTTGQVAYALLSFGGFLGIGSHVHPVPWEKLRYDEGRRGYVAEITSEMLDNAPTLELDEAARPRQKEGSMYDFWDVRPYW